HKLNGGPPLDVSVHFSMNQEWSKKSVRALAPKLAQLVSDNPLTENQDLQHLLLQNSWNDPAYFPYEIDSISIMRYKSLTDAHWICPEADVMPQLSGNDLQRAIDAKNNRVTSYRQKLGEQELWLLIIHGLALSSMFEREPSFERAPDARQLQYHSKFDRTFFFNWFEQAYVELRSRR
ncbi:MAG TPA: hypothetical protein VFH31_08275, partial [Pyrinomonadaceae bacterium]|nr:hypothetical protein [Pyrinomonadaceae bacterium]